MRSTYLILTWASQVVYLLGIILTPIFVTPGWYFWSVMFAVIFLMSGIRMGERIDEWNKMDLLK